MIKRIDSENKILFGLYEDEKLIADITIHFRINSKIAEAHHEVYTFSHSIYRRVMAFIEHVKSELEAMGVEKIITVSDHCDKRMEKYWRKCGFWCFVDHQNLIFAGMEVNRHGS